MVKQGYKQTEIGTIPEDWEMIAFKNCFNILSNNTLSRAELNDDCGTVRNIHYGDILVQYDSILDCSNTKIPYINNPKKSLSSMCLEDGDIVIADTAEDETVGKAVEISNVDNQQVVAGLHTIPCRAINKDDFAAGWLGYYINHDVYHHQLLPYITGTKVSAISKSAISNTMVLVPPIDEQKCIANALSDVDSMISSLEKLIEKKKAIKHGAMKELLTGKKRLPGFTGEWKYEYMEKYLYFQVGYSFSSDYFNTEGFGLRLVKNRDLKSDDQIYYTNESYSQDFVVLDDDVLIGMDGDFLPCLWKKGKSLLNQRVGRVKTNEKMSLIFAYYLLQKPLQELQKGTGATTVKHLSHTDIAKLKIKIPVDVNEQTAIASVLSDMDSEIEALEQKLAKTRQLKQGMMQQLLTGKIRLIDQEKVSAVTTKQKASSEMKTGHNHQFDDAVMIATIVNAFYSEKYPLGRKKVQKLLYLLRRKQEVDTSEFKKKAAGPYADEVRYKGGEPIAKRNGYIATSTTSKGTSFSKGKKIDVALNYVQKWGMESDFEWLVSQFRYTSVNDLELYATIDMAICDLQNEGIEVSVNTVKNLIGSNKEWKAKLKKNYFSDADIARAITMSKKLFS